MCGEDQTSSFNALKKVFTSAPVLAHPNYDLQMEIFPDACGYGIGGVLAQRIEGAERPIAYASRLLTKSDVNYSMTEKSPRPSAHRPENVQGKGQLVTEYTSHRQDSSQCSRVFFLSSPQTSISGNTETEAEKDQQPEGKQQEEAQDLPDLIHPHPQTEEEVTTRSLQMHLEGLYEIEDLQLADMEDLELSHFEYFFQLDETFKAMNQILLWLQQLADSLDVGFSILANGHLSPQIISPAKFNKVIKTINGQLPRGWSISSNELWVAYRKSTVSNVAMEN
ncbi:Uncharacterized protein APZ42_024984 [Daphnia magna]|uniref:Reverse transcriptase/retrotransposon-derived protein RNase H-like domain-containing protein n=1 Tax=Daphnia magna TaxID=35525 RepID=A0A164TKC9_9CRUS|nr:Uncharacterized protein APZ42_024984 [Daphnia magna]